MKTRIITIALITITSFANQLIAQETAALKTRTKSNQTNERTAGDESSSSDSGIETSKIAKGKHIAQAILTCRVTPTEDGCVITMDHGVKSPRDAASGLATGRRMHKPLSIHVSSADNAVTEVKSPRDAASGLPTGKRQHKPITITKELDKSSSDLPPSEISVDEPGVNRVAGAGGGSGKASMSDLSVMSAGKATFKEFTITKRCDGKTIQISCPDGECEIPLDECPNGTCDLVCSWSWGLSQQGTTMSSSGSAGFSLEMNNGACTAMAINEKGLPGEKKPKKTTTNNPK